MEGTYPAGGCIEGAYPPPVPGGAYAAGAACGGAGGREVLYPGGMATAARAPTWVRV